MQVPGGGGDVLVGQFAVVDTLGDSALQMQEVVAFDLYGARPARRGLALQGVGVLVARAGVQVEPAEQTSVCTCQNQSLAGWSFLESHLGGDSLRCARKGPLACEQ